MTRAEIINELLWNTGGDGWGICTIGNMLAAICGPQKKIRSPVLVGIHSRQEITRFTDDELTKLLDISRKAAAKHIRACGSILESDNLSTIRKNEHSDDARWTWKKRSWECGPLCYKTLDELETALLS